MNRPTMRDALRDHYEGKILPASKLMELAALAHSGAAPSRETRKVLLAASLLLAVGLLLTGGGDGVATTRDVAEEIAANHARDDDVEFRDARFDGLSARMDRLDFELKEPSRIASANYRLLGARYCSLQGSIACQIKLARPDGSVSTLYLVRDGREFSGVREGTQRVQNLEIELWREDGLLVGFASASR